MTRTHLTALLIGWLFLGSAAHSQTATEPTATADASEDALITTAAVFEFFDSKCNDCHGSHLQRPKGKFGYVMDLKRVAANDDWVTAHKASKSELFRLVNEDEMPGKDSKYGPATAAEKLALRHWIEIGTPTALPAALVQRQTELLTARTEEPAHVPAAHQPFFTKLLAWIGRFHAASTHFPIALLMVAVFSEILALLTKKESWLSCTRLLVILGAGSAVSTAVLGWLNAYAGVSQVYQIHKWIGTATALWALVCAGCAVLFECREGSPERARLRGALLLGALLVSIAGFLGGAITFGLDHYNW